MHQLFEDMSNAGELRCRSVGLQSAGFTVAHFACENGELDAEFDAPPADRAACDADGRPQRRFRRLVWRTAMGAETVEVEVEHLQLRVRTVSASGEIEYIGEPTCFYALPADATDRISNLIQASAAQVGFALV